MKAAQSPGMMRKLKGFMMKYMHGMITCREFEDFIMSYLEGSLPAKQKKRFEWHLKLCRECREYLAAYERSIELGRAVFAENEETIPGDVPEDLVQAVLDSVRK